MVFNTAFHALHINRPRLASSDPETPELGGSPSRSTLSNVSTLTSSIRCSRFLTTKKHKLHDPRTPFPAVHGNVSWSGPRLCGNIVSFDPSTPSTPVEKCFAPLDPASIEEVGEKKKMEDESVFHIHAELVRPASVVFARHLSRGRSTIPVPGQDHDVIQLFVRFLYSGSINSNVADACSSKGGCKTLTFKLHDNSSTHLTTPDDEEQLLVKSYLFAYSYSCWTFCDALIDTLICKIIDQKRTLILHNLLDLNTNCGSFYPLKILIAHLAIYTWTDNQFCGFALAHKFDRIDHVRFWADVGDYNAVHQTGTYGLPKAPWRKSACYYHVHALYPKMEYVCYTQGRQD